jgi:ketosteroid isomerase-like protein
MAGGRVDRFREAFQEYSRTGKVPSDFLAPDFELHQASSIVDTAGVFRGPGAFQASMDELLESFEDVAFEPTRFLEAPSGEIVILVHARGRGRGSGLEAENDIAWVWSFRGGRAVRMTVYEEQADALAAVGLGPGAGEPAR